MNIDRAKEMYLHDPVFHNLVDMVYTGIVQMDYTPSEVRSAAMLGAIMYEERHGWNHFTIPCKPKKESDSA